MKKNQLVYVLYAFLAAVFYALNAPLSKVFLADVPSTYMASFLYLGAGVGVGILYAFHFKQESKTERLDRQDIPYTIGMVVLDIAAPIFLMLGLRTGSASGASLLGNFEIVATSLIAWMIFREKISARLWIAIALITIASILLSLEGGGSFDFSTGSLWVLLAACCWGLENNCTRGISQKSTYEIVTVKGLCSGAGSFLIAVLLHEKLPAFHLIFCVMLLGFVSYGLSIFMYIRAQSGLGAAKTSAYYAIAPFIGVLLSVIINGDKPTWIFAIAFVIMMAGTVFVILDTLVHKHRHLHTHVIVHTHDGVEHTHVIEHEHGYIHIKDSQTHTHTHTSAELEKELNAIHDGKEVTIL